MKKPKRAKEWHASSSKIGMGDYYGTGIKQPIGRMRDNYEDIPVSSKNSGKPPKSLA